MLAVFRRGLNTWPARLFFFVLVLAFATWGIGDVVRNLGADSNAVATIGGQAIDLPQAQDAYRRGLDQARRMLGDRGDITPEIRRMVAAQAVDQLIAQATFAAAIKQFGLAVPDEAVRQAVWDERAFQGPDGRFNHDTYVAKLRGANLTEQRYLQEIRGVLGQQQVLGAVRSGIASPDTLARQVFAFQQEKRAADAVDVLTAAAPPAKAATEAELHRWYDNHPEKYSSPEYRRIKAVILSPQTVARDVAVSEEDIRAAYEQHRAEYQVPEKRSVQVLLAPDEATLAPLSTAWITGADWPAIQKEAEKAGATATELTDATLAEFPAPELGRAVFDAPADTVMPAVHSPLGWHLFRVTRITPGVSRSLDDVRAELKARIAGERAVDLIYDRAGKLEDLLAGGVKLDELPTDLGLAAVTGTLDATGHTPGGEAAPIPGDPALRDAVVHAAFAARAGDPPKLEQVRGAAGSSQSYYALVVEEITPPKPKPYDEVAGAVAGDWTRDSIRHDREQMAAGILAAVKGGKTLAEAAAAAGLTVRRLPPTGRDSAAEGVPPALLQPLFALKPGEPTMVETPEGFVVAVLAEVQSPDPSTDPVGYGRIREALARAIGNDVQLAFAQALRDRSQPRVNTRLIESLAQPPE